jgi:hypothetical protein
MDPNPDPGGPKTRGSGRSGSATLPWSRTGSSSRSATSVNTVMSEHFSIKATSVFPCRVRTYFFNAVKKNIKASTIIARKKIEAQRFAEKGPFLSVLGFEISLRRGKIPSQYRTVIPVHICQTYQSLFKECMCEKCSLYPHYWKNLHFRIYLRTMKFWGTQ